MSTAISFDPEAAANALLAEQSERERVVRDLAASYGDILQREHELDRARTTHLQLRARASEFGITDAALKKAGIPNVGGGRTKKSQPRRTSRKSPTGAASPLNGADGAGIDTPNNGGGTHA